MSVSAEDLAKYGDAFRADDASSASSPWAAPYTLEIIAPQSTREMLIDLIYLRRTLDESEALAENAQARRLRDRLLRELAQLESALQEQGRQKLDWVAFERAGGELARFERSSRASTQCGDKHYNSDTMFFATATATEPVVLQAQPTKNSELPGTMVADGAMLFYVSARQALEFRAAVRAVQAIFRNRLTVTLNDAGERLSKVNAGWTNYLAYGYSQYPWESFANSWGLSWDHAPRTQIVLLHPEPAVLIDVHTTHSVLSGSLLLHGLGLIRYGGDTRRWFLGASVTGAVTTSSKLGFGAGGTLHMGHTALHARVPHISLSLLAFPALDGKPGPFLGISADLWRLFQSDSNESIFQANLPN